MRAAGIDPGAVRVGLAVADELGVLAHPRPHLDGRDEAGLVKALKALADREGIEVFVVGLPRRLSGEEGEAARRARRLAAAIERETGARVELFDEWLTTREADARLRSAGRSGWDRRRRVDGAAAAVVLQAWLDGRRANADGEGES